MTYCLPMLLGALLLTGCASQRSLYEWSNQSDAMYSQLVNHEEAAAFKYLQETIAKAEKKQRPVPPGVYADYGFMLYRQGKHAEAASYFQREADAFPESAMLMQRVSARLATQADGKGQPANSPMGGAQ